MACDAKMFSECIGIPIKFFLYRCKSLEDRLLNFQIYKEEESIQNRVHLHICHAAIKIGRNNHCPFSKFDKYSLKISRIQFFSKTRR